MNSSDFSRLPKPNLICPPDTGQTPCPFDGRLRSIQSAHKYYSNKLVLVVYIVAISNSLLL